MKVDVLIVLYGSFPVEALCLESVKKYKHHNDARLVVYDNNEHNYKLAKIWNDWIAQSDAEYFCLLNSDTVVTEGWLDGLLSVFDKDNKIGIVGPSTNSCASSQKICTRAFNTGGWTNRLLVEVNDYAKRLRDIHKGRFDVVSEITGFCYLLSKSVWSGVGGFNERIDFYGQESEFNYWARRKGWRMAHAKGIFVFHQGGRLNRNSPEFKELRLKGRKQYKSYTREMDFEKRSKMCKLDMENIFSASITK